MKPQENKNEVYFIYDGECPICNMSANFFKIKESIGQLNLIDARTENNHPIVKEINDLKINIDEGMVIKMNNSFYHGADALNIMALIGSNSGIFNKVNYFLFKNKLTAKISYPILRMMRNILLKIRCIKMIND